MQRMTQKNEDLLIRAMNTSSLAEAHNIVVDIPSGDIASFLGRHPSQRQAILFRLLPKNKALTVFEKMSSPAQANLVTTLRVDEVAAVFSEMDPDDRVGLLDELPAKVAKRLLQGLTPAERNLTGIVLGYPDDSIGRRMSPEVIQLSTHMTASNALVRVQKGAAAAETVYLMPVVDHSRHVVGVVSLRELLLADSDVTVGEIANKPDMVYATDNEETAARRCALAQHFAMPVVDSEQRLLGILTVDDALAILQEAATEDQARQGGAEPIRTPYLSTSIWDLVRSRVVWLLVLAIGATLTVHVMETFESTLSKMVVLSVFVPLMIGTGGNTGNQAATTVTRALALREVRARDTGRIVAHEAAVGACLGLILGSIAFGLVSLIYSVPIGLVIGLTMLTVCTIAATSGGLIPVIASLLKADPAVFSNPFISTLLDATGLVVYFLIAKAILGI